MKLISSVVSLMMVSLAVVACADEDVSVADFGTEGDQNANNGGTKQPDLGTNTPAPSAGEFEQCAADTLKGAAAPVHLVIALDVSGSMCEPVEGGSGSCGSPTSKWEQTKKAFSSFFSDPNSKDSYGTIITWSGNSCSGFNRPRGQADVALPDTGNMLSTALSQVNPGGGTPTVAAIQGALEYSKTLKASLTDGGKVVIVLATDGLPTACGSVSSAASAAGQALTDGFPVYVVGVGAALNNLNQIAAGAQTNGGTAILVQKDVATELNKALADIKGKSLGCGLQLPKPAEGKTINFDQVNLTVTDNSGATKTLTKSQDCSNADGWKYVPDTGTPTGIELCTSACNSVKTSDKGSVGIVLGCDTKVTTK